MSPAGKSEGSDGNGGGVDETSVLMRPVSLDEAESADAGQNAQASEPGSGGEPGGEAPPTRSAQVVQDDDLEDNAEVPPWQRLTSEVRQPEAESPYTPAASGQLFTDSQSYADPGYPERLYGDHPGTDYPAGPAGGDQVLYADQEQTATNLRPVTAAPHGFADEQPPQGPPSRSSLDIGSATASARQQQAGGATPSALRRPGRGPRRASLQVKRVDPWSVLKLALVLSIALFFVWLVAVGVLYGVLDGMGVWDQLNGTYSDLVSSGGAGGGEALISAGRVFGIAAIVGGINIILFTAISTVAAFIYNVSADLAGGLELTLAERE